MLHRVAVAFIAFVRYLPVKKRVAPSSTMDAAPRRQLIAVCVYMHAAGLGVSPPRCRSSYNRRRYLSLLAQLPYASPTVASYEYAIQSHVYAAGCSLSDTHHGFSCFYRTLVELVCKAQISIGRDSGNKKKRFR